MYVQSLRQYPQRNGKKTIAYFLKVYIIISNRVIASATIGKIVLLREPIIINLSVYQPDSSK